MAEMLAAWNELDSNMDMRMRDNAQRSSSPKRLSVHPYSNTESG